MVTILEMNMTITMMMGGQDCESEARPLLVIKQGRVGVFSPTPYVAETEDL